MRVFVMHTDLDIHMIPYEGTCHAHWTWHTYDTLWVYLSCTLTLPYIWYPMGNLSCTLTLTYIWYPMSVPVMHTNLDTHMISYECTCHAHWPWHTYDTQWGYLSCTLTLTYIWYPMRVPVMHTDLDIHIIPYEGTCHAHWPWHTYDTLWGYLSYTLTLTYIYIWGPMNVPVMHTDLDIHMILYEGICHAHWPWHTYDTLWMYLSCTLT